MTYDDFYAGVSELVSTAIELGVTLEEAVAALGIIMGKLDVEIINRIVSRSKKSNVPG